MTYVKEHRVPTTAEILIKVGQKPGLCTNEELEQAKRFYLELEDRLKDYRKAWNSDPLGYTIEAKIENIEKTQKIKGYLK